MLVSEVMDPEVVTVERRQSLVEVAKLLHEAGASSCRVQRRGPRSSPTAL
jgi:CBS domain-containing protein